MQDGENLVVALLKKRKNCLHANSDKMTLQTGPQLNPIYHQTPAVVHWQRGESARPRN